MGKGKAMPGPIRDESPCKTCTDERHTACHDTCEKHSKYLAEIKRVKENRRKYMQQNDIGIKKKR